MLGSRLRLDGNVRDDLEAYAGEDGSSVNRSVPIRWACPVPSCFAVITATVAATATASWADVAQELKGSGKAVSYADALKALFENAPEILRTAAASFQGLVALSILILGVLVGIFLIVQQAKPAYFLVAIGLFILGAGLFLLAVREDLQRRADTKDLGPDRIVLDQDRILNAKHLRVKAGTLAPTEVHDRRS